ncbi:MAG TPA: DUF58 domain-containing protein [Candidatus Binatia bacterium]|nr:DUF58 domain-containing protein [Candidatus Binatia bacterium]
MRFWLLLRILLHPLRYVRERIDAWVMARVKRQPGPVQVPRHRVYIVPSNFGFAMAFMTFAMLLGSMNYSNNMAFALTFLLAGLGLIAMNHTHANLVHVQIRSGAAAPVFAGDTAHFEVHVHNPGRRTRYSISAGWPRAPVAASADLPAGDHAVLLLPQLATKRGWLPARVFAVSTEFPLGMFHAWTWLELDMSVLVYPKPAPAGRVPPPTRGAGEQRAGERPGLDEFAGLRNYQRGDTPRSIHWKSFPKLRTPMVKQFQETLEQEFWLDWNELPELDAEGRLSQLARWVLDADAASLAYGLRLPGTRIAPGRGESHRHACLKTLALHGTA